MQPIFTVIITALNKSNKMAQLSEKLLTKLKNEDELVFAIATGTNRRFETVRKWAFQKNGGNVMLSSRAVVSIIKEETGLSEFEILEPEKATA